MTDQFRTIVQAYADGIYGRREALYRLVELKQTEVPEAARQALMTWLGSTDHQMADKTAIGACCRAANVEIF